MNEGGKQLDQAFHVIAPIHVSLGCVQLILDHLWCSPARRAACGQLRCRACLHEHLRQSKVAHLCAPVLVEQEIMGFEITVNDHRCAAMQVAHAPASVQHDVADQIPRECLIAVKNLVERAA